MSLLETRVRQGDYLLQEIPPERNLAIETGTSRTTVRKAVDHLVAKGILRREPNGRIAVPATGKRRGKHLALLAPAYVSITEAFWLRTLERLVEPRGWKIKAVGYTHEHDPVILDTVNGFDGVFFSPLAGVAASDVIAKIRATERKMVVLGVDMSAQGFPSLVLDNPLAVRRLLDSLPAAARRSVACLNTQPVSPAIKGRIEQWQFWTATHNATGPLIDEPVAVFNSPAIHARQVMRQRLEKGRLGAKTLFCTTGPAALGAMRAMADCGLRVGRDIAVCAADDLGGQAQLLTPSLTCMGELAADIYFQVCLDWFAEDVPQWLGPLRMEPHDMPVFMGESSGPVDES